MGIQVRGPQGSWLPSPLSMAAHVTRESGSVVCTDGGEYTWGVSRGRFCSWPAVNRQLTLVPWLRWTLGRLTKTRLASEISYCKTLGLDQFNLSQADTTQQSSKALLDLSPTCWNPLHRTLQKFYPGQKGQNSNWQYFLFHFSSYWWEGKLILISNVINLGPLQLEAHRVTQK